MTATTSTIVGNLAGEVFTEGIANINARQIKALLVTTPATTGAHHTIEVNLRAYGLKNVLSVSGYVHTTINSVIAGEAPTTAVSGTTLTITVGGTAYNTTRAYLIFGEEL